MAGGKATTRKDEEVKVTQGQLIKTGKIVARGVNVYKAGKNIKGQGTLFALCSGKVYFTRKKTPHGKFRTFINVMPSEIKSS